jgi:hypothetical protein
MKIRNISIWLFAVAIFLAGSLPVWAQTPTTAHKVITVKTDEPGKVVTVMSTGDPQSHVSTYTFVASEMGFASKVVKGSPFSADTVTEFTQILGNGQRIYRSSNAALYRDSEGRTRREQAIDAIGPYASAGPATKTVFINDPVAGISYIINPGDHTAVKTIVAENAGATGTGGMTWVVKSGEGGQVYTHSGSGQLHVTAEKIVVNEGKTTGSASGGFTIQSRTIPKPVYETTSRTEPLGTQMIEGVAAQGTRTIETIPAGAIGNDTPIEIISERWYSEELGMEVKTVRNDPLSGQNIYQLTNIRRSEPAPDLFQLPADYAVKDSVIKLQTIKK